MGAFARGTREESDKLLLGAMDVYRDWGWAPEYVEAMWLMLQQPAPEDFIIATGEANSLQRFVDTAFERIGRRLARSYVVQDHGAAAAHGHECSVCADPSRDRGQARLAGAEPHGSR